LVRDAFVNPGCLDIGADLAVPGVEQINGIGIVGVVRTRTRGSEPTSYPIAAVLNVVGLILPFVPRDKVPVVVSVHEPPQFELPQVVQALDTLSFKFSLGERGQQHRRQDGNDRNHH